MTIILEEADYIRVAYLARRLVPKTTIAQSIGFKDHSGLIRKAKKDKKLAEALDGNYAEGKIDLHVAQYRKSVDHYLTICRDCGKISDDEFLESCPFCDKEDPEKAGKHNRVRHRLIEADTAMLIHMGKHHLGQTDRSLVEVHGDKNHPLAIENLTEEQIDKKLEKLLPLLTKEYGKAEVEMPKKIKREAEISKKPDDGPNIAPES
jgi:hypothetical protein